LEKGPLLAWVNIGLFRIIEKWALFRALIWQKKKRFRNVSSLTWWEMKNLAKGLCIMLKIKEL
jgi:hypothetical protein